jgi:oxygen-dependent protoporphyrinogen oxidase
MTGTVARHVVVIGGGVTGLATAYRLQDVAVTGSLSVTLVEAADRVGGWVRTDRWHDVLIEAGPDSFLATKPAAKVLALELGLGDELIGLRPGYEGAFVAWGGRCEPLPEGLSLIAPARLRPILATGLLSTRGKLRLALDLLVPPRRSEEDESLASFVRRRLGSEVYERIAQPLLAGIYAGDAERLSLLATFPHLRELERRYGSLIRGTRARHRSTDQAERSPFLSLRGGMRVLVDSLAAHLECIDRRTGSPATTLVPRGAGYRISLGCGEEIEADAVVVATPAHAAAQLLEPVDQELAQLLRGIPYASSATVTLVYHARDVAPVARGRGVVVPAAEGREVTAVTWVANKFEGRAPPHLAPVRVFLGRYGREAVLSVPDEALVDLARSELRALARLRAEPVHAVIHRLPHSMPQYLVGHLERLEAIERRLAQWPGLVLAGAAYRGVGLPDCVASAERAARATLARLECEIPVGK